MNYFQERAVPERIKQLKQNLFATPTVFCFERARIVTRVYRETEGEHKALRRARALRAVLREMTLLIRPGEKIVGQRSGRLAGRAFYPEYNLHDLTPDNTPADIWAYWQGKSIADRSKRAFPEQLQWAEQELACGYVTGTASGFGHVIVDYERAISKGFLQIRAEAAAMLAETPEEDQEGRAFLQAACIAAEAIMDWAERYADLARQQAEKEPDPVRRQELLQIEAVCRRVPARPARNLAEALQSFWFVHLALHIEQYGWSISAGRFDQYIWPFWQQGLASGLYSQDEAWELLLSLWVKFLENIHTGVGDTVFQNMTLGGQDKQGHDQSNALSWACLAATAALHCNQPALSVRWHPNIDPDFWDEVHRTIAAGMGLPALFNDTVIIEALVAQGIPRWEAVGYGLVGCVEASVPGRQMGVTAGGHLNCAKALELALNSGQSMISGRQIGAKTPPPAEFSSFTDFWDAYRQQIAHLAGLNVLAAHISGEIQKQHGYCPLMSSLLDDCLQNRRDMVYGSTRYNLPGVAVFGTSNACDSVMSIKKWVCKERLLSWQELQTALSGNYQGQEDLRLRFARKTPRYGNDLPEVDALYNEICTLHADFFRSLTDSRGGHFLCGIWPVNGHIDSGTWTAATPDGRLSGSPLADGVGACQGADSKGPTALLKSVARLDHVRHWPAGNTCNIKFPAANMQSAQEIACMRDLVTVFMQMGGQQLQINVIDAKTLKAAMDDPEPYRDLVVRVAGYSAYFTRLSRAVQSEILSRTEQRI